MLLLLMALSVLGSACGASDPDLVTSSQVTVPSGSDPVSASVIEGLWVVQSASLDGDSRRISSVVVDIRIEGAVAEVRTGCGQALGSFTFQVDSGQASFSIPGRPTGSCPRQDKVIQDLVLDTMEAITTWSFDEDLPAGSTIDVIEFTSTDRTAQLTLARS